MNVAFCIDNLGMIGLGPTLISLIRHCSNTQIINIFFLCNKLNSQDKINIKKLLDEEDFLGNHIFIDFDPLNIFKSFRSLHGDYTTYGRLLLADFISDDQVLYLDSDLVVETDILEVNNFSFNGHAIAAVEEGQLKSALESNFYVKKLGLSENLNAFNAGVLLLNLNEWRLKKIKDKCLNIGRQYPNDLLSCDQTLLNALFAGNFARLPKSFNCAWYTEYKKPTISNKMIIHFVGSPKPWDIGSSMLHRGYSCWKKYLNNNWKSYYLQYSYRQYKRLWEIRRSYLRAILNIVKS